LRLLADQSFLLEPPAGELPVTSAPDDPTQQRMLAAARTYVAQSLPRVPNFLATRTTNRYDDSPQVIKEGSWPVRSGLHLVDSSSREISIREERESQSLASRSVWQQQVGLVSGGEFGSTLGLILGDTAHGKVTWNHWEQTAQGLAAVFRYEVPKSASHYEVISSFQRQSTAETYITPHTNGGGVSTIDTKPSVAASNASITHINPGYHGSLWLDPATGVVLRVTMEADLKQGAPFKRAALMVQYGAVVIGDNEFTCPVRGLALSTAVVDTQAILGDGPTIWLNETLFTNYHRFASTSRIVADTGQSKTESPEQESPTPKQ
jgi:hypothetical protein